MKVNENSKVHYKSIFKIELNQGQDTHWAGDLVSGESRLYVITALLVNFLELNQSPRNFSGRVVFTPTKDTHVRGLVVGVYGELQVEVENVTTKRAEK